MKNGNFIIFFWQISAKACSIMVSKVKCMGMAGRGDFSRICFFFLKVYVHFLFLVYKRMGKMLLFLDVLFFGFAKVSFKKQQKRLNPHSKIKYMKKSSKLAICHCALVAKYVPGYCKMQNANDLVFKQFNEIFVQMFENGIHMDF